MARFGADPTAAMRWALLVALDGLLILWRELDIRMHSAADGRTATRTGRAGRRRPRPFIKPWRRHVGDCVLRSFANRS